MTQSPAELVDQVEEQVTAMLGTSLYEAERAAVDFEAFAGVASNSFRERLASLIADEIRTASEHHQGARRQGASL
ncbi:hypothetical protein [Methylobacterium sp.]|uniref:hypothetical protein n=1 Tax=Methylobacterium sp. TaxID=409 RepID=UPI0025CF8DA8|nr:hypothetical protein [Methylobacterium sp.]MBY0258559.1 hypothetical protein [Methylobacterium sp.]